MRIKHIVEFYDGNTFAVEFKTKKESDKALRNALHNNFCSIIRSILIEPINHPELRERIDLTGGSNNDN